METNAENPNPDELLRAVQAQDRQKRLGHLKIFFGMSAGVGKTFSMLQEAQQKKKEGLNVVIGLINTHGRKETEALVEGLPIIPERWINYKDTVFEEMDLDAIIKSRPDIVLVDELAHTNVPGAKHPKRWQDVIEILDAGIDVYTTLNVQHLESRKDVVESLTGIQIRETVPDLILERATTIELVDIPPPELLQRLHEGKVYLGDQSKIAAMHFFKEENLMALREIALRCTAEKVDHDLHGILQSRGWRTRERLMVAISPNPFSEQLIRSARRLAFELDAPWIVVYVDRGVTLDYEDQTRLNRHFILARELGAEVVISHDLDIAAAFQRIAHQRDITRIVIGRPTSRKSNFWNFFQRGIIDRLEKENKNVDIIILREDKTTAVYQRSILNQQFTSRWKAYCQSILFVALITLIGWFISPIIGYKAIGFILLLGIFGLSYTLGRGPVVLAAFLSALCLDFFFIPPLYHLKIFDPDDVALIILYFITAVAVGMLTSRLREQDQFLHRREEKMERLYEIERDIANSTNFPQLRANISARLEVFFPGKFDILIQDQDGCLIWDSSLPQLGSEKERAAVAWVFEKGRIGGWSTDTLPSAEGIYFPIKSNTKTVGVLVYLPARKQFLSMDETNFIQTIIQQLGIYMERYCFEEHAGKQDYMRQVERLHRSIFHSLNRSFYIPLDSMATINEQILNASLDPSIRDLSLQMQKYLSILKHMVDNIIAISELESGFVHFDKKNNSISELLNLCLFDVKSLINNHPIKIEVPSQSSYLPFDPKLLRLAVNNLIINALEHTGPVDGITIKVEVLKDRFLISVSDLGTGVPDRVIPHIFDKFYHDSGKSKGLGLGLAVVKGVAEIHQGKVEVTNLDKGSRFTLVMPL